VPELRRNVDETAKIAYVHYALFAQRRDYYIIVLPDDNIALVPWVGCCLGVSRGGLSLRFQRRHLYRCKRILHALQLVYIVEKRKQTPSRKKGFEQ
jgi:hypothetical protein